MTYLFSMWKNTRMIVLVAVCAAIYAAALIAFKTAIPLVPGIAEVRVAGVFLVVFGFLFGPAGAWGLGLGNLIGDVFGGTFGPGSLGGFVGNLLQGYAIYSLWINLAPIAGKHYEWKAGNPLSWVRYILITMLSSGVCAVMIAVWVDLLGIVPYSVLSKIIVLNNVVGGMVGVLLLIAVYDITRGQLGLLWIDVMDLERPVRRATGPLGAWVLTAGVVLGLTSGLIPYLPPSILGPASAGIIILGCLLM
ncbi:MAG TPA: QueT transporter family protein [Syntrophorhabdaceae bacterium]|jgi:energy-coupling factor transport system substrate-specific component